MNTTLIAAVLAAQTVGAQSAPSTAHPECDRFIKMVTECIETKVPPSARADEQQRLDAFRSALGFVSGAAINEQCAQNIRTEMQRDRYGCYAKEAARSGVQTPCALVNHTELQHIVGRPFLAGEQHGARCQYATAGNPPRPVVIEVHWTDGRQHLAAARETAGKTIAGVGDDAHLIVAGLMPTLHVRRGDAAFVVQAQGASDQQLIAIARKALERLR